MGWSIFVNWPGAEERQQGQHPGFCNDDGLWAELITAVCADTAALATFDQLGLKPLLAGASEEVGYVDPDDLIDAAVTLRVLLSAHDPSIEPVVRLYEPGCPEPEKSRDYLVQDLDDVEAIARYVIRCGAREMTLEYTR